MIRNSALSRLALSCFDTGLWLGINFGAWGAGRQTDCGSHDDLVIFRIFIRYFLLWFQQVVPRVARFSKAKTYEVETLWLQSSFLRVVMSFWWIIKGLSGPSHALVQMEVKLSLLLLFCLFRLSDERERLFERERFAAAMQIFLSLSRAVLDCFENVTSRPGSRIRTIALSPHT